MNVQDILSGHTHIIHPATMLPALFLSITSLVHDIHWILSRLTVGSQQHSSATNGTLPDCDYIIMLSRIIIVHCSKITSEQA